MGYSIWWTVQTCRDGHHTTTCYPGTVYGEGDCDGRDPEITVSAVTCPNILNTSAVSVSGNGDGEECQVGDGASLNSASTVVIADVEMLSLIHI